MFRLALYQYKDSIQKISFTRFLKEEKSISLSDAKNALDKFLEGVPLLFIFNSKPEMIKFKLKAETFGASCKVITAPLFVRTSQLRNEAGKVGTGEKSGENEYAEFLMLN